MLNAIIYDLEIKSAIRSASQAIYDKDLVFCDSWHDYANMGVSTLCAYDYLNDAYHVYCDDNIHEFYRLLAKRDYRIGHNNIKFDDNVLTATYPHLIFPSTNQPYDTLQEIWKSVGADPNAEFNYDTHGGYGLDACVKVNFGLSKTGHGANAPIDWQRGRIGKVINYCMTDVRLTKRLMDKVLLDGKIINPRDKEKELIIRRPGDLL